MVDVTKKRKITRLVKKRRKQVEGISSSTDKSFERHFIRRLVRLPNIQRFLLGWVGLLVILTVGLVLQTRSLYGKYQSVQPQAGGIYNEGITGSFTNANPLYASSPVDSSVSKLVFSGLLKSNPDNKLEGDLAESWAYDQSETVYTVILKKNLKWHDGKPLTSKDVIFTYRLIQYPDTKSYLYPSWQGIKVEAKDDRTITFTLPNSLSSFPHSLTNGIVPEHVLKNISPSQLRSNSYNNVNPIGSGPFSFSKVEVVSGNPSEKQERIALKAYDNYHFQKPKLDSFTIRTFAHEGAMVKAYEDKNINAMIGLASVPDQLAKQSDTVDFSIPLTGQVLVFFKTSQEVLKDVEVRKALVLASDKKQIFSQLSYPLPSIDEPLLRSHIGYDKTLKQITGNAEEAKKLLENSGWKATSPNGIREKNGQKLSFSLYSQNTSEYNSIANSLQKQWRKIGVEMSVELQSDQDLQSTLAQHNYDALLYGISIGPDPDVFAYWHGSQADPRSSTRLNFSEYKSSVADQALEGGRTRSDPQLRTVKYKPFLQAWRNDAPALALYQPRMLYIAREPMHGFDSKSANSATDRFSHVEKWTIREGRQ